MILVLGSRGFLGKWVCARLQSRGLEFRTPERVDQKADAVINCAARCGGIATAMKDPASLLEDNIDLTFQVLRRCRMYGVRRLVQPISNCLYPARASVFREPEMWDGPMHPSVEVYGFTRRAAVVAAETYRVQHGLDTMSVVLPNLYGPDDHLEEERSHALTALVVKILRAHRAGEPYVTVWGTGKPVREWMYVDDGAEALVRAVEAPSHAGIVNVGTGSGIGIAALAGAIAEAVGYRGELRFDTSKPDGAACKTIDGALGDRLLGHWPKVDLVTGIRLTVEWAKEVVT